MSTALVSRLLDGAYFEVKGLPRRDEQSFGDELYNLAVDLLAREGYSFRETADIMWGVDLHELVALYW